MSDVPQVSAIPVLGLPEIVVDDDLGALIVGRCEATGIELLDGDLVVVAQKVVSKAEGAIRVIAYQVPSPEAIELAGTLGKDPRIVQIVLDQSRRVVRAVPGVLIVETVHGFICANAGVDQSNIELDGVVTILPVDSDRSAREIRDRLRELTGCEVGVLVSDTFNRPWREGSTNVAIGVAGFDPLRDLRGSNDDFDREMTTSTVSLADEVASTAQLVMGESGRVPVALVRGVDWIPGEYSADRLLRPAERDLFR
ncbi:MAG: coenzyme F420-0:L-glutamate ligase [Dehalococcoidia bacterium]|jgi:coenzyme F420-0:L-glutamate ligase/coenzyme F420-1:gamma-L-glutamate ligase|tara:strand:- start:581 stop:1342 length:762 start_codon:yes stop_codon:yes gene_type:complete